MGRRGTQRRIPLPGKRRRRRRRLRLDTVLPDGISVLCHNRHDKVIEILTDFIFFNTQAYLLLASSRSAGSAAVRKIWQHWPRRKISPPPPPGGFSPNASSFFSASFFHLSQEEEEEAEVNPGKETRSQGRR